MMIKALCAFARGAHKHGDNEQNIIVHESLKTQSQKQWGMSVQISLFSSDKIGSIQVPNYLCSLINNVLLGNITMHIKIDKHQDAIQFQS